MRALLTLFLVFGAIIVTYVVHWARRASVATADASAILKDTGSLRATAKQLYAEQRLPDKVRLSHRQRAYLDANEADFLSVYGTAMDEQAVLQWKRWIAAHGENRPSEAEAKDAMEIIISMSTLQHGKIYCENRGIV